MRPLTVCFHGISQHVQDGPMILCVYFGMYHSDIFCVHVAVWHIQDFTIRVIVLLMQVGILQTTLSNFAEECGSNGSGASSGGRKQVNSYASLEVPLSNQSSSAGEAQQSADKPTLNTSPENDIQPGPSRQQEHVADEERDTSGTGIGTDMPTGTSRRAGRNTGTGESDSTEQTQHDPTVYGVLLQTLNVIDIFKSKWLLFVYQLTL